MRRFTASLLNWMLLPVVTAVVLVAMAGCAAGAGPRGTAPAASSTAGSPSTTVAAAQPAATGEPGAGMVVYVSGDIAGAKNLEVSRRLAALVPLPSEGLQLFVYLGDVYPSGSVEAFASYDSVWGSDGRDVRTKTAALIGNLDTAARESGWIPYWSGRIVSPWPGSLTQTDPPYYAVKLGSWKFIMLDTSGDLTAGGSQYEFLVDELREPGYRCIVCGHRPRWSAGQHGDDADLDDAWKAMCDYGAVAYLSGHDHGSQIQPARDRDGDPVEEGGVVQVVAGAGGDTLYPFVTGAGHSAAKWGDDADFALLRLTLSGDGLVCDFLGVDGKTLHSEVFDFLR